MRQWHLPTELMCDQHLLGEHVESHMFLGSIQKGISIDTYTRTRLFIPLTLISRHDYVVNEMTKRGMNHASPMQTEFGFYDKLSKLQQQVRGWDMYYNLADLCNRCPKCKAKINDADARGALHKALEDYYHLNVLPFVRVMA